MKRKESGFTMIEMLIVLGILTLLVGLLLPALTTVKKVAKEAKQKAQFSTIELGLASFKNDHGDYPPSDWALGSNYCGAQKLTEALLGWDLLGFHPDSAWRADGLDTAGGPTTYDPAQSRDLDGDGTPDTLNERKEPYLELGTTSAFKLGDLFRNNVTGQPTGILAPNTYVLCDAFTSKKITIAATGKTVGVGAPILYYRANTSQKMIRGIYNVQDNEALVDMKQTIDGALQQHPLNWTANQYQFFYGTPITTDGIVGYIQDPKIEARPWPYRPDSYLLISAGADGLYGTPDDIRNFGN